MITNVRGVGQECLQLTGDEINKRFPGLSLSSSECGAFEPRSGLIQADLALKALQVSWPQLFKKVDSTLRWIIPIYWKYLLDSMYLEQPRTTLGQVNKCHFLIQCYV